MLSSNKRSSIYCYGLDLIVANNHQPNIGTDTVDTYFNLFEAHMHLISKFRVARHKCYLMKQESKEVIEQYVLKLHEYLREYCFPEAVQNEMLSDSIIYGARYDDLVRKFLSKCKELTINCAVEMIRSFEARNQSYTEI